MSTPKQQSSIRLPNGHTYPVLGLYPMDAGGRPFFGINCQLPWWCIEPRALNPRFLDIMEQLGKRKGLTMAQIGQELEGDKDFLELTESLDAFGQKDPLFVQRDGNRFIAWDGSRRHTAMGILRANGTSKLWGDSKLVNCVVFPSEMSEQDMETFVVITHCKDWPKGWRSYNKMAALVDWYNRQVKHRGADPEEVIRQTGMPPTEFTFVTNVIAICRQYRKDTGDDDPKYSQWYEAMKQAPKCLPELLKKNEGIRHKAFRAVKENRFKNPHKARGMFSVLQSASATRKLLRQGIDAAIDELKEAKPAETDMITKTCRMLIKHIKKGKKSAITRYREGHSNDRKTFEETFAILAEVVNEVDPEIVTDVVNSLK